MLRYGISRDNAHKTILGTGESALLSRHSKISNRNSEKGNTIFTKKLQQVPFFGLMVLLNNSGFRRISVLGRQKARYTNLHATSF